MAPTNSVSQAHHGIARNRSSIGASGPPRTSRRSAWRATHSSCPTAGPDAGVSEECGVESVMSHLSDVRAAEQALRTEDHERDEDREDDEIGPLRRDVSLGVGLRKAEDETAGHRAGNRADASDHRCREALEAGDEAD